MARHFVLISGRKHLQQRLDALQGQRDGLIVRLQQVASRSRADIERDLRRNERELQDVRQNIQNFGNNLYLQLQQSLQPELHAALARALGNPSLRR